MQTTLNRIGTGLLKQAFDYKYNHVRKIGLSVGPLLYQIKQLDPAFRISYRRVIRFKYREHNFTARYLHDDGGKIQVTEMIGTRLGGVVAKVSSIEETMELDLKAALDRFIRRGT